MKAHPDSIAVKVAEVAPHEPVPSRLGMLRFERLNDASWAMLFLDPECESQLGLPASELCSLTGFVFASLMEPAARYDLHDEIQAQLAASACYRIRYRLHGTAGIMDIVEAGEQILQYGRSMLHGYLMVCAREPEHSIASAGLQQTTVAFELPHLQDDYLRHLSRSRAQQNLIARLARHRYGEDPLREAAALITEAASEAYAVAYASIWLIEDWKFHAVNHHRRDGEIDGGPDSFDGADCPGYVRALQDSRVVEVRDVHNDPRTREFTAGLQMRNVGATLEAGIRNGGELVGVLRLEHIGTPRDWHIDEIAFAGELADHFAQVMANRQRSDATHSLHLFQRAVEQTSSAFLLVDRDGRIEYANPSFTSITQYSPDEVQGCNLSELPALESLGDILREAGSTLARNSNWQGEFHGRRKNHDPYWGRLSISKVFDENDRLSHFIVIYEDITENKLAQQRIERLSYTDNLTGLVNRTCFIHNLEQRFAETTEPRLLLLLVDIDNFKRINDSLGHRIGDKLLAKLARRLSNCLDMQGVVARFASNEFAVLLDDLDPEGSLHLAQHVLRTLDKPLYIENHLISVSGSVGLACAPHHGPDPQTLMKHAGLALHKAKANGKNQVQVFTEALNAEADFKLFLENSLRRALAQDELEVFYQPKICLRSGRLLGLEALLRWNHPEKGRIRPDEFIGVAEETGLIIPIGKWAARQACRMARALMSHDLGELQMAINLSPRQFADPSLVSSLADILHEEGLPPALLEIELTESLLLDATETTRQQLNELKAMGLSLAMDDFGTGYSSLSYLKKFPIDVIKIDRSFIKDIPGNQDDMEITSAVIAMARNLKLRVVAEGIETSQQLVFLRKHRCDIGQGYLFDKPIPSGELIEGLRRYQRAGR
ncbi:putative bifunctional diguanylate cyclase/phosphodiesterase [Stutzerimonas tarimensis]|uniref:Bifunctional diguanylate cyclase/phosphodiesterase n=1 Tax=Stutzerimonas tarimensis TaxID=1507735 RepID=A0ABV7T6T8_9GAMM